MNKKENNKRFSKLIRKIMSEPNETPIEKVEVPKLEVVKNIIKFSEIVEDTKVSILQSMN